MIVIGLTGSIATGKSTVVGWLREMGIQVYDADADVHHMFQHNQDVIEAVRQLWPECVGAEGVDRSCLRQKALNSPQTVKQLEAITHPIVRQLNQEFIEERKAAGDEIVFMDIPLLFETGLDYKHDATLVVACSAENQRARALQRGIDPALLDQLLGRQLAMSLKILRADFVLNTDGTLAQTRKKLLDVLHQIELKYGISILRG